MGGLIWDSSFGAHVRRPQFAVQLLCFVFQIQQQRRILYLYVTIALKTSHLETLYKAQEPRHKAMETIHKPLKTIDKAQGTILKAPNTINQAQETIHKALKTICKAPETVHNALKTIHKAPETMHKALETNDEFDWTHLVDVLPFYKRPFVAS